MTACFARNRTRAVFFSLFFNQAVWEQKSKRIQVCNCTNTKHASFAAFSTTTAAFTSSAVNKYLRQSSLSTLYIRQTLNPVWDAFTAIWSLLSHSLQHTCTHFTSNTVPTQPARLPLYFIMCHVTLRDMVPDFIYVEQWWLSYLCRSEIAVDQCR